MNWCPICRGFWAAPYPVYRGTPCPDCRPREAPEPDPLELARYAADGCPNVPEEADADESA